MNPVSRRLSQPAYDDLGPDQHLTPLFAPGTDPNLAAWNALRESLRQRWDAVLGKPSFGRFDRTPEVVGKVERPNWHGTLYRQPTGPDTRQLVLLMEPAGRVRSPRPGAVVPYYHPDPMAGYDLGKCTPISDLPTIQFGRHLVEQGYVVACTEAFPFNTVPKPETNEGFAWWRAGAERVLRENPRWTGMGKLIWDTCLAADLLLSQPEMDRNRIVVMGHSLGGKMAFYAGALDERFKAIIGSDFGIGWDFTNWADPWYLGPQIQRKEFTLAHHELLALHAPRSFLLVGGQFDKPASWQYLNEAKTVYRLYGREDALGFFDHATGHEPTEESLSLAYRWLAEQFGLGTARTGD